MYISKSLFGNYEGRCFRGKGRMAGATKEALRAATTEQLRKHSRAGRRQAAFSPKTLRAAGLLSVAGVGSLLTARCGALRAAKAALATAKIPRRSAPRSFQTGSYDRIRACFRRPRVLYAGAVSCSAGTGSTAGWGFSSI